MDAETVEEASDPERTLRRDLSVLMDLHSHMSIDITDHVLRKQFFGDVCDSAGRLQRNLSLSTSFELPTLDICRPIKKNIDVAKDHSQKMSLSQRRSLLMVRMQHGCKKARGGANAGRGCHLLRELALPLQKSVHQVVSLGI